MAWKNYSLDVIPHWCEMSFGDHFDGMGGCWGISHGEVADKGEKHCQFCQFHYANRGKSERELLEIAKHSQLFVNPELCHVH